MNVLKRISVLAILMLAFGICANAQLTGTKNIPGDYADLNAAITDLNTQGVGAGGVTFNVVAVNPQTAPAGGYVIGGAGSAVLTTSSAANPVVFTGNNNTVTAFAGQTSGNLNDAIFKLIGADYITLQGFTMQENAANTTTTAGTNNMTEFGVALFYVTLTNGSQNNTIQNNNISLNRTYQNTFGIYSNTRHSSTAVTTTAEVTNATGSNSNNKIYGNNISNVDDGIIFVGAGTTIAAIDTGNDIGGASAATGNTISNFGYNGTAISSYVSVTGSNFAIYLNQQINDNASFNTITSAAGLSVAAVQHGGIVKAYSVASPTAGTVTTTNLNNNIVTLNAAATTAQFTGVSAQGMTANTAATINMNNNLITGSISGATATTSTFLGLFGTSAPGTFNINGNTVRGVTSTATTGGFVGIQQQTNAVPTALNINNNKIGDTVAGAVTFSAATTGAVSGVVVTATGAGTAAAVSITGNDIRGIVHSVAASSVHLYFSNAAVSLSQNISNNTFTNLNVNTTGSVTFISNNVTLPTGGSVIASNNSIVTAFNKPGAGGTVTLYLTSTAPSSVAGTTKTEQNNNFSNITLTGATAMAGWTDLEGATGGGSTKNISNNTFTNWNCGTGAFTAINVQYAGGTSSIANNTINNITGGGTGNGILLGSTNGGTALNVSQNTINTLTTSGTAVAVNGISAAGTIVNVFKNKLYDINATAVSGTVNGILVTGGTTVTVFNNLVGDLKAPIASSTSPADSIRGISVSGGTTVNLYFNTVYLNATSSGANFGTSAVYVLTTVTTVTFRNNIFDNTSTATGSGFTVAYRRSSTTLTTYGSASNTNDFYAGTPSISNLIFYDGANSDQMLASYKARVSSRDSNSVSENPPFVSTTGSNASFLHISTVTPTQLESGGTPVSGITDDFDGDTRNAVTPDIGADEFAGTPLDLVAPTITYTPLLNTSTTTNRTLTVTITDPSGVAGGALAPRIYFRKNGGAYFSTQCTGSSPTYTCTIDNALLGGVTTADVIQYFVVAQDTAGNVGANPSGGFAATDVNNVTSPPTTPNQYTIVAAINGTFNVGAGQTYTSLTNAGGIFEFINNNDVTGNIIINITSDLTGELGTNGLNAFASPYTITIKPSGAAVSITGTTASNALIRTNGASRVTIDGSLSGGTDRSLTITNTSTTAPQVVRFGSSGTTPITNDTLKNTVIINGVNTGSAVVVTDNAGTAGRFNNITIQNNDIQKAFVGIFTQATGVAGNGSGLLITQNKLDNTGANAIRIVGVYVEGADGATVSNNTVGNFSNTEGENDTGIWLATGAVNTTVSGNSVSNLGMTLTTGFAPYGIRDSGSVAASGNILTQNIVSNITTNGSTAVYGIEDSSGGTVISRNNVQGVINTSTSTYGAYGINVSAGNNVVIRNNFVSNVTGDMTGGGAFSTTFGIFGIRIATGTGHQIYHNSVNLYGLRTGTATTSLLTAAFAIVSTASTGMDVRNNIFANNITGGTTGIANVSIYLPSGGNSAMNLTINKNAYFYGTDAARQGVGQAGTTAGTNFYTSLAMLAGYTSTLSAAGTNDNASQAYTTAPPFVSNNDLHLNDPASPLVNAGDVIPSVTLDFDGQTRDTTPDIGADEIVVATTMLAAPNCTGTAPSPLVVNATNKALLCFSLSSNTNANFTALNVPFTTDPSVKFTNPRLISSVDTSYTTTGDNTLVATGTVDTTQFIFAGFSAIADSGIFDGKGKDTSPSLTATPLNFFIVADVSSTVDSTTPATQPSVAPGNVTVSNGTVTGATVTGRNYTFSLTPTAATAQIGGRVIDNDNQGLSRVYVTLSGGSMEQSLTVLTNGFGYYSFPAVAVGETYIVTVASKTYTFNQPTVVFTVSENLTDINFIGYR